MVSIDKPTKNLEHSNRQDHLRDEVQLQDPKNNW